MIFLKSYFPRTHTVQRGEDLMQKFMKEIFNDLKVNYRVIRRDHSKTKAVVFA